MSMSGAQVRIVDPILSTHARGYSLPELIGDFLFPIVDMPTRAARRIEFDRASFRRPNIIRAPGARYAEVSFGYTGQAVNLIQRALGAKTPYEYVEEANAVPGIDLIQDNVDLVLDIIALDREINQASVARNAALYAAANKLALAGGTKWSVDATGTPEKDVTLGKEQIRKRTGKRANTLVLGAAVAAALKVRADVKDRFKYTTEASISDAMLATFFDIPNVYVGDAIYDDDLGAASFDVWGGDAILAYVPMVPTGGRRKMAQPGYGYTYRLPMHPTVEQAQWDQDTGSWKNIVSDEWSAEMVGPDAGFLIQAAI